MKLSQFCNQPWFQPVMLGLLVFICYQTIFHNTLVWDDWDWINWTVLKTFPASIPAIINGELYTEMVTNYRPVKNIILGINYVLWQDQTWGYHLQAILIHFAASSLVSIIGAELTKNRLVGFVAGLIFAAHPIHVEAITWITASVDSYAHLFYLTAFYFYIKSTQTRRSRSWLDPKRISLVFAGLAFFSNELSFSLPLVLFLYDLVIRSQPSKKALQEQQSYWWIIGSYFLVRFVVLDIQRDYNFLLGSVISTGLIMIRALMKYVELLIWPVHLSVNHHLWDQVTSLYYFDNTVRFQDELRHPTIWSIEILASIGVIIILILTAIFFWKRKPLVTFCIGMILVSLSPVLQLVPTTTIFAERYLYIGSVAYSWGVSYLLVIWLGRHHKNLATIAIIGLVGVLSFRTINYNQVWRNDGVLWASVLQNTPASLMALTNFGSFQAKQGSYLLAEETFSNALELHPDNSKLHLNLAYVYLHLGDITAAKNHLDQAVKYSSSQSEIGQISRQRLNQLDQSNTN